LKVSATIGITYSELRVNEESGKFCDGAGNCGPAGFVSSHIPLAWCRCPFLSSNSSLAGKRIRIDDQLQNRERVTYFYLPSGVISRVDGIEEVKSFPGPQVN
jgi:hypothetical protein